MNNLPNYQELKTLDERESFVKKTTKKVIKNEI